MPADDSSRNDFDRVVERLEHLEQLLQMQTVRLHAIEQRLGLKPAAPTRTPTPLAPPHEPEKWRDARPTRAPEKLQSTSATTGDDSPPPPATPFDETPPATPPPSSSEAIPSSTGTPPKVWEPLRRQPDATDAGNNRARPDGNRARTDYNRAHPRDSRARAAAPPDAVPQAGVKRRSDLETRIGGSWFNWIGIIAFTFGVAFFLKYAFDNKWIGETGRVLMGIGLGVGILFAGERLRARGMAAYAYVLSGGGILILYLSVYAAFAFYQLVGQIPAFLAMAAVTATAVLLSARYNALPIAVLGLIGGFLTPLLLSTGKDNQVALFGYITLLDAGVLALAYFKQWRSLNYMAFVSTLLMQTGWLAVWYGRYGTAKLWPTIFFLSLFFLMFSMLAILHNVVKQRHSRWPDISLILANATFYFGMSYGLLDDAGYDGVLGSFALMVSAFYILLFYFTYQRHRADRLLRYSYLGSGITFLTMAVSIQLDQQWVTIGWATEALVLTWIGLRSDEDAPRLAALGVFAVALVHWFGWDMVDFAYRSDDAFIPLLNRRAVSCAALIGALAGAAWLYRRAVSEVEEDERSILITVFVLAANALALTLLTADVSDYFTQAMARAAGLDDSGSTLARLQNTHLFSLSILWTLYGATALVLGILRRMLALRLAALVLLLGTIIKTLVFDVGYYYNAPWHILLFNQNFISLAVLVASLACCAWVYARSEKIDPTERAIAVPLLFGVANLLAVTALSVEALGFYDRPAANLSGDTGRLGNNKQFALTAIWTLYAAGAAAFGFVRGWKALRYGAMALMAVATFKVLSLDITYYAAAWHLPVVNQTFAAFALAIAALGSLLWWYSRSGETVADDERRTAVPVITVVANLVAIIALSAEASGYFQSKILTSAQPFGDLRDLRLAQQLSLSVIWAIYGAAMLVVGLARGNRLLRVMALALLGVTTLKVFFWDLASLDKIYRIISFIVLGAILLAVSYIYQQRQQRMASVEQE